MRPYYEDAAHGITIFHGDAVEVLPTLDAVNHVITDPPYSEHTHSKQWIGAALTQDGKPRVSTAHTELGFDAITVEQMGCVSAAFSRLARRWVLTFSDIETAYMWRSALASAGLDFVRTCIWDKVDSAPQFTGDRPAASAEAIVTAHQPGKKQWNGGGRRSVFRFAVNGESGPKPHPSTKPLSLMLELVSLFTDPGDLILDPFMGSGTTLVAAKQLGRKAIGVELEEKWCEVAVKRLERTEYKPPLFEFPAIRGEQAAMEVE